MKLKIIKYAVWTLTVLWMIMIFLFSAQVAQESDETSGGLIESVLGIFPSYSELSQAEQISLVDGLQFLVRKTAHFTEYACLGMLMYGSLYFLNVKKTKTFAFIFSALYAVSDEIHQLFVEGRACQFRDMCIDSSGAFCGIMLVFGITLLIKHIKSKNKLQ